MSPYERQAWERLTAYWEGRANRRGLPHRMDDAGQKVTGVAAKATGTIGKRLPEPMRDSAVKAGELLGDKVLGPTIKAAAALLELVTDWSAELNDPAAVITVANKKGLDVTDVADLRGRDLRDCDRLLTMNTLKWRTFGAVEGGGIGALALVPIAGLPTSLTADLLVVQVLSNSIAARIAYSYGFDAKDPDEAEFIRRLVNRSFVAQAARAAPMHQVAHAAAAARGRVNWSQKLLKDQRLLAALKKLMESAGPNAPKASIQNVGETLPLIGIVLGAGTNSAVLGAVAADAQRYCQTRFLSEKYGLPMPAALGGDERLAEDDEVVEEG